MENDPETLFAKVNLKKKILFPSESTQYESTIYDVPTSKPLSIQKTPYALYTFITTDDFSVEINLSTDESSRLIANCAQMTFDASDQKKLLSSLSKMKSRVINNGTSSIKQFLGIDKAKKHVQKIIRQQTKCKHPKLVSSLPFSIPNNEILIGFIADELFGGILKSSFEAFEIAKDNFHLIQENLFDLIIIQKRSVDISIDTPSIKEEQKFISDVTTLLQKSTIPVYELDSTNLNDISTELKPLINCRNKKTHKVFEHELCNYIPKKTWQFNENNIAIATASDLYQHEYLNSITEDLISHGYKLTIFESTYGHVPIRTWQRFNSNKVKVYNKLNADEISETLNACNFIIIPTDSLRCNKDLISLSSLAITSGCIPVFFGPKKIDALFDIVSQFYVFSELLDYITQYSTRLSREKKWLSIFRQYKRKQHKSSTKNTILQLAKQIDITNESYRLPTAEIICITKRPHSFQNIKDSFERQSYRKCSIHVIFNIEEKDKSEIEKLIKLNANDNFRISIMEQSYNIGSCLNYGIRNTDADYWFKMDDDDYYGRHYIEDAINFYLASGADVVGKMVGFVHFNEVNESYLRKEIEHPERRFLRKKEYFVGATLSGKISSDLPLFSTFYRNSCDSKWIEELHKKGKSIFVGDIFNFVVIRGDIKQHTWQLGHSSLMKRSTFLLKPFIKEYFDAS